MKHAVLTMIAMTVFLALQGCATAHFMKTGGTAYPPYKGEVRVLDVPLEGVDYEVIGIVSADSPWDTSYDRLLKLMQDEAALNGAEAIIMCSERICLHAGEKDSNLAAPAIRILPRTVTTAAAPPPVSAPQPEPGQDTVGKALAERGRATLNIKFDTNMAVVKDQYHAELAELAGVMRRHPGLRVMIEGHTDSVGSDTLNMILSQRRADSVKDYLATRLGIDASRLDARGYGETRPVAGNDTGEGRQQNRRVEAAVEYDNTVD